jgi:hypothetical protein
MKMFVNGREYDMPTNDQGNVDVVDVRRAANIPQGRAIIMQRPTGENYIMPKNGAIRCNPYDHFIESPRARRG